MNLQNRKRAHSQAFSLAPGHTDYIGCNPHASRYPPFHSIAPKPANAYYSSQVDMVPPFQNLNGSFVTPNPSGPVYSGGFPAPRYPQAYSRVPPVYPSQFNAALAAYAHQQYQQYGNAPQSLIREGPNYINSNNHGRTGMPNSKALTGMPFQNPSRPGPYYFPLNDLIGTYMAPQQAPGSVVRRNMNMNMAANPLPPPRMGRLTPSPNQLNFQDLTLRDAQNQNTRPYTPPRGPQQNRTVVGTIPTVVLRE
jgi:hypothetical protein